MADSNSFDQPIENNADNSFGENGIDETALKELKDSMPSKYGMAISICLTETQKFLDQIHEAMQGGDAAIVETSAHSIKSSAAMVGMGAVSVEARSLEEEASAVKANGSDINTLVARIEQLNTKFSDAKPRMEEEVAGAE